MVNPAVRVLVCPGPFRLLVGVAAGDPRAADPFVRWVLAHPEGRRVAPDQRQDVLHDVVVSLFERAERVVEALRTSRPFHPTRSGSQATVVDRRLHSYVAVCIANRRRTQERVARREVRADLSAVAAPVPAPSVLEQGLRVLDLLEGVVLAQSPRPSEARRTLGELRDLALGDRRMREVVAAEAHDGDVLRARDRLYVRHRRMRGALGAAAARMHDVGVLDDDDAHLATCVVNGLLTRRRVR